MPCPKSQSKQILAHLKKSRKGLTSYDAFALFGCTRLAARVYDLKEDGHNITSERVKPKGEASFVRYQLS